MIKEKMEEASSYLLVDAGNFGRGRGELEKLRMQYMARAMHLMGYDAINLAREEILLGTDEILNLRDREQVPLVSTNLYRQGEDKPLVFPYVIKRMATSSFLGFKHGGVKVAILGVASDDVKDQRGRVVSGDFEIIEPREALRTTLQKLRKHCDVIILLSDLDLKEAMQLSQEIPGIDVFFIGKGANLKYVEEMNGTIFAFPRAAGTELGDLELVLDDHKRISSYQAQWTLLDRKVADDEEVGQLVNTYKEELEEKRAPREGC